MFPFSLSVKSLKLEPDFTEQTEEYKRVRLHQLIHRLLTNFHFFLF